MLLVQDSAGEFRTLVVTSRGGGLPANSLTVSAKADASTFAATVAKTGFLRLLGGNGRGQIILVPSANMDLLDQFVVYSQKQLVAKLSDRGFAVVSKNSPTEVLSGTARNALDLCGDSGSAILNWSVSYEQSSNPFLFVAPASAHSTLSFFDCNGALLHTSESGPAVRHPFVPPLLGGCLRDQALIKRKVPSDSCTFGLLPDCGFFNVRLLWFLTGGR